jgi:uncharacterized protein DUF6580
VNITARSLVGVIGVAALLRILPHPWNFTPIAAMALFSGAHFRTRIAAFTIPLAALFISDLFLGFYSTMGVTYMAFALIVMIGMSLHGNRTGLKILAASVVSSVLFFLVSNFGVWLFDHLYSRNGQGLLACYMAALPFFQGTLVGDAAYTALLFGAFHIAETRFPTLQHASSI